MCARLTPFRRIVSGHRVLPGVECQGVGAADLRVLAVLAAPREIDNVAAQPRHAPCDRRVLIEPPAMLLLKSRLVAEQNDFDFDHERSSVCCISYAWSEPTRSFSCLQGSVPTRLASRELEHVPPRLNRGDSRHAKNRRIYLH